MAKTKAVIASHNPVKITSAKQNFITASPEREFIFAGVSVYKSRFILNNFYDALFPFAISLIKQQGVLTTER